jgi:hypothetical protein
MTGAAQLAAEAFLREQLRDGPRDSAELKALAQARGIDAGSLQRAKRSLGIRHRRMGVRGQWGGRGAKFVWERDPSERRAEARGRLLEFLLEATERDDLSSEARIWLKETRDQLAREGLAELGKARTT